MLSPNLQKVLSEIGFKDFTPIQQKSIPILLANKDLIGKSKTGSGKTAAFALPILEKINLKDRSPQALILCPTRELSAQVAREMRRLARRHDGLHVLVVAGGSPAKPQAFALQKGVHVVVGTPGRVLDLIKRRHLDIRRIKTLVLDEADRMLEMGFEESMEAILDAAPKNRQTVFFSATFPQSIEVMSQKYQRDPVTVSIENDSETPVEIQQIAIEVAPSEKLDALILLLDFYQPEAAIVFCNLKRIVAELADYLNQKGISAAGIHGDLEQFDRDLVMTKFRNRSTRVLVATDVAARGIDIDGIDLVCNYDLPLQPEVYVHRIGRTGRAGKKGVAVSLMTSREVHKIESIETFAQRILTRQKMATLREKMPATEAKSISTPKMKTLRISSGRKQKMRPGDILGALTGDMVRIAASQIGKIEIHDHYSFVAVSADVAKVALERLNSGTIKGRKLLVIELK